MRNCWAHYRFWRPLIGITVAYAIAAQSLLIVLGGFGLIAPATQSVPGFAICHHEDSGTPGAPAKAPGHPGCTHCIFCFAGSHHALIASPAIVFARLDAGIIDARPVADKHALPSLSAHSIANPRGPPPRA
jgi:hypothetical protein